MIEVSAEKGKFIIKCPFHMNAVIRDIPGKRWSSPKRAYVVPFSRKAAEVIIDIGKKLINDDIFTLSSSAMDLILQSNHAPIVKSAFPPDYQFKTDPMPHQHRALDFAWGKTEIALFMAMRTGKTKVIIDWACALKMHNLIDHILIFCPISVRSNWEKQFAEHGTIVPAIARFDLSTKSGQRQQTEFNKSGEMFKAMIVGIESMAAGGAYDYTYDFIVASGRVICVVDESHMIKTHNANRSEKITQLGSICSHRAILTGTPIAASPLDLYSQYNFLDPNIIGFNDFYSFKNRYAVMGGYENRQVVGYDNMPELMADIAPYTFQITAEEVCELPPKIYVTREVELPAKVRTLYNLMKKHKKIPFEDKELILSGPLDRTGRMLMLINGVMVTGESGVYEHTWVNNAKVTELLNLIEENPTPTVIWTNGKMELAHVVAALQGKGIRTAEIHGDIDETGRIKAQDDFQSGRVDYLVANVATGGTGIKLSRARMLVYMSNSFQFVHRKQSEERATDFIEVGESVLVVDIVAADTYDVDVVQAALKAKQDVAQYVRERIAELKLNEGLS